MTDEAIALLAPRTGTRAACAAAGVPQASWYRRHRASPVPLRPAPVPHRDRVQPRALARAERQAILDALHSERFADTAPAEAWAALLDEGIYLGSVPAYYRVLRQAGESRERRAQAAHPATVKPEGRGPPGPGPAAPPRHRAYVSCDPATLARDIAVFAEAGRELGALRAFDAFPMTQHVEYVATLTRPED